MIININNIKETLKYIKIFLNNLKKNKNNILF